MNAALWVVSGIKLRRCASNKAFTHLNTPESQNILHVRKIVLIQSFASKVLWSLQQLLLLDVSRTILHISVLKPPEEAGNHGKCGSKMKLARVRGGWPVFNVSILTCFMKTIVSFIKEATVDLFLKLFLIRFSVSRSLVSSDKLSRRPRGVARWTKDSLLKHWLLCGRKAACSATFYPFTVLLHVAKPASANESLFKRK